MFVQKNFIGKMYVDYNTNFDDIEIPTEKLFEWYKSTKHIEMVEDATETKICISIRKNKLHFTVYGKTKKNIEEVFSFLEDPDDDGNYPIGYLDEKGVIVYNDLTHDIDEDYILLSFIRKNEKIYQYREIPKVFDIPYIKDAEESE